MRAAVDERAMHGADELALGGEARGELGHGRVRCLGLLEGQPGLGHGPHHVLEPVHVVEHEHKVAELGVHRGRVVGLGGARDVHAPLGLDVREAAGGQPAHEPHRRVHGGDHLRAHARQGGRGRPHPVHQLVHVPHHTGHARDGRVQLDRPRLLVLRALEDVALVRAVPADHIVRLAQRVLLEFLGADRFGHAARAWTRRAGAALLVGHMMHRARTHG